jgi:hypothetical protein
MPSKNDIEPDDQVRSRRVHSRSVRKPSVQISGECFTGKSYGFRERTRLDLIPTVHRVDVTSSLLSIDADRELSHSTTERFVHLITSWKVVEQPHCSTSSMGCRRVRGF